MVTDLSIQLHFFDQLIRLENSNLRQSLELEGLLCKKIPDWNLESHQSQFWRHFLRKSVTPLGNNSGTA